MSAIMMWLGMAAFFFALIFTNIAKTQQRYLQKLGKAPDEKYKKLNVTARVLFAVGMSFWIVGAIMTGMCRASPAL
jgi:fatty acid desaturase